MDVATKIQLFRDNVRYHMSLQGVSQCELARRISAGAPHINRILQGKTVPGLDTCERIADALGIPLEGLIAEPTKKLQRTG